MKRKALFVIGILLSLLLLFVAWSVVLRDSHHGPQYVLWKYGFYPFDPDVAYRSMVVDTDRNSLVAGLTASQLDRRFGKVRTKLTATDYQRHYNSQLPENILWLGDSQWAVIMKEGKGFTVELCKG
jgi:hypothetical protein